MAETVFEAVHIERMYLGAGVHRHLGDELERLYVGRALLLTGKTLAGGGLIEGVRAAAGGRVAAEFSAVAQHNPTSGVAAAVAAAQDAGADGLVAFGGGSVVDAAKAVSFELDARLPIVDLATTLSGAEFAASYGQTDDASRVKLGNRDLGLTAKAVFLDSALTAETPAWLWAATGFRAIDHAVETILAPNAIPYLDALAAAALRVFSRSLPLSLTGSDGARMACLEAAWMAHAGSYHIEWGLSHQMGRQLGPRFNIPHGYTSAVLLPAVVELSEPGKVAGEALVADALGVPSGDAADGLRRLASELRLPTTLREAGITDRAAVNELFAGRDDAEAVIERAW